jgi:hypothetical protein
MKKKKKKKVGKEKLSYLSRKIYFTGKYRHHFPRRRTHLAGVVARGIGAALRRRCGWHLKRQVEQVAAPDVSRRRATAIRYNIDRSVGLCFGQRIGNGRVEVIMDIYKSTKMEQQEKNKT